MVTKIFDKNMTLVCYQEKQSGFQIVYKTHFINVVESYYYKMFTYFMDSYNFWIVYDDKNGCIP